MTASGLRDSQVLNILIIIMLLLPVYAPATTQTARCDAVAEGERISVVGAYSNMRYTAEHAYGHTVMLWRAGNCYFGLFESAQGLAGDTPIGELQDLRYDGNTGALSFSAKLTIGVTSAPGSIGFEPSRDLFMFEGALKANTVAGVITLTLQNSPSLKPKRANVVLGTLKSGGRMLPGPVTYSEWRQQWSPALRHRGPKW